AYSCSLAHSFSPARSSLPIRFSSAPSNYNNNNIKNTFSSRNDTQCGKLIKDDFSFSSSFVINAKIHKLCVHTHVHRHSPKKRNSRTEVAACCGLHGKITLDILVGPFFALTNSFRSFLLINHLHLERSTSTERHARVLTFPSQTHHHPEKEQSSTLIFQ
ncbi:AAEL004508-PA, partial [Aedes aegypti]